MTYRRSSKLHEHSSSELHGRWSILGCINRYAKDMPIIHWIVSALAILVAAYLIPGVEVTFVGALVAAIVLALINIFIKPLVVLLTLPINVLTLGLFSLVINALLVMLASMVVPGFSVDGFLAALLFSILLSLINWLFNRAK